MDERCKNCGALIALVGIRHRCITFTAPATRDGKPLKVNPAKRKRKTKNQAKKA